MQNKLHSKHMLDSEHFDLVDWDAIDDAQTHYLSGFSLWMSKQVTGFCGVGKMMFKWNMWDNSRCPGCDMEEETARHLLVCNNVDMKTEFEEATEVLEKWMINDETCPDIADCIASALAQHSPTAFELAATPSAVEAAREQDLIGWTNMFEGKISKRWQAQQDSFYKSIESQKKSRSWAHGLVHQLLEFTHRMWMKWNSICHSRADGEGTTVDE